MPTLMKGLFARFGHPAGEPADDELLTAFVETRDAQAFESIVRRHGPMVRGVCRRVLRNEADADDAFQAAFLVLVRKADAVRPRSLLGNWLYGVAVNVALKGREVAARRLRLVRNQESGLTEQEHRAGPSPESAIITAELAAVLDQELGGLPDTYRAAVVACDVEGQTRKEAAGRLGWSEGTVASRLARGRAMLAERLTRRGVVAPAAGLTAVFGLAARSPAAIPPGTAERVLAGHASPAAAELARGAAAVLSVGRLKSAAVWLLAAVGAAGVGAAVWAFAPSTPEPARVVGDPEPPPVPRPAAPPQPKAGPMVLTNPAKDITIVSDRDEKFAEFFKRQPLMVASLEVKKVTPLLTAADPSERQFLDAAAYNTGAYHSTYGTFVRVAPIAKPVAGILRPVLEKRGAMAVSLIFRMDAREKDVWHVIGFTTRPGAAKFFTLKEKVPPDDFTPADLVFPGKMDDE